MSRHTFLIRQTVRTRIRRIAVIRTAGHDLDRRQQIRERSYGRRLPRPAMAHDQNAADQRIDEIEYQGQLHLFLADYGGKRITHNADSFSGKASQVQTAHPAARKRIRIWNGSGFLKYCEPMKSRLLPLLILPLLLLLTLALSTTLYARGSSRALDRGRSLNAPPPVKVRLLVKRAMELAENGEFRQAMMVFRRARSLAPNYLPAHVEYIRIKEKILGRFSAVEAEYKSLLQREPDNPVYLMANYFRYDGSLRRDALEKVVKLAPEWAWGHYAK